MTAALQRRTLIAAAFGGCMAWLGRRLAFGGHVQISKRATIAALCSQLNCPEAVGTACKAALAPTEVSEPALVRSVTAALQTDGEFTPAGDLLAEIRRQSRQDFQAGRVVMVGGWMLSLTETRTYALASLLARKHGAAT